LIADKDYGDPTFAQPPQGVKSVGAEAEFTRVLDVVRTIFIDDAIPIDKKKMPGLVFRGADPDEHGFFPGVSDFAAGRPSANHPSGPLTSLVLSYRHRPMPSNIAGPRFEAPRFSLDIGKRSRKNQRSGKKQKSLFWRQGIQGIKKR
jgi:hypothetical protein